MGYKYTNRRGDVYHLQTNKRSGGGVGYSFTRKVPANPADQVPEGYEVYENPDNAQVLLRKVKPTSILPRERQLVEKAIRRLTKVEHFIVEVDGNNLVIYTADVADADAFIREMGAIFGLKGFGVHAKQQVGEVLMRGARYSKMLRFILNDEKDRHFNAERWCFLGDIDDWYPLDFAMTLPELLEKYVPHLGKDSFFELI